MGAGNSQVADEIVADTTEFIRSTASTPKAPLSVPAIVGAIVDLSISATTGPLLMRARPILRPPRLRLHEVAPKAPRYDFATYFYTIVIHCG